MNIELNPADVVLAESFFNVKLNVVFKLPFLEYVPAQDKLEVAVEFARRAARDENVNSWRVHPYSMMSEHLMAHRRGSGEKVEWSFKSPSTRQRYLLGYNSGDNYKHE